MATPTPKSASPEASAAKPSSRLGRLLTDLSDGALAKSEDKLFRIVFVCSALVHVGVLAMRGFEWSRDPIQLEDEWSMDADLVADADFTPPSQSALPQAAPAPEAAVRPQMLPQLPKKFAIEEAAKPEEIVPEEIEKKKEPPKEEPKKEDVKEAEKPKEQLDILKKTDVEDNKIKQDEALKRLALEKLREADKTAEKTQAPEENKLARVAELLDKNGKGGGAVGTGRGAARYGTRLKAAVQRNYNLPEAYNLKGANMVVELAIAVGGDGQLVSLEVYKSSGDAAFDQLTIDAAKASVPLPKPPPELIGQTIILSFKP